MPRRKQQLHRVLAQTMTEDDLKAQVLDLAAAHGWRVAHFRPARTQQGWRTPVEADGRGWPDLVLVRERVIFVELKAERGSLSADQRAWLEALTEAGAEVYVWKPRHFEEIRETLAHREVPA